MSNVNQLSKRLKAIVDRLQARGLVHDARLEAEASHVAFEEMLGAGRSKSVAAARHRLWNTILSYGFSYNEIAVLFDVNHATVMAACGAKRKRRPAGRPAQLRGCVDGVALWCASGTGGEHVKT